MEKIEFKVEMTEQDLIDYNMKQAYGRVSTWALMSISVLIVAFTLYGLIFKPVGITMDWSIYGTAIFAAAYLFLLPTLLKISSRSVFRKNPMYKHPFFFSVSDKGVKITVDDKDTVIKWDSLYKFQETDETYLFYIARGRAFIVPKRCLDGEEMIWDLKQLVKQYVDMSRLSVKYKTK